MHHVHIQNVYAGEVQGPSLCINIDIFDDNGKKVTKGSKGELVVKNPFPSNIFATLISHNPAMEDAVRLPRS